MRRNKKVGISIAVVGLIILLAVLSATGNLPFTIYGQGITVTSISPTKVISNDADLANTNFIISAVTGGGQSLTGEISPLDFKKESGYDTTKQISISVSPLDEKVEYRLRVTGERLHSYFRTDTYSNVKCDASSFSYNPFFTPPSDAPSCPYGQQGLPIKKKWNAPFRAGEYICQRICIQKNQFGTLANIEPSQVNDEADITLKVGDETITKRISTLTQSVDLISNRAGYVGNVKVIGAQWTGAFPPSSADYNAVFNTGANRWTITGSDLVRQYSISESDIQRTIDTFPQITLYSDLGSSVAKTPYEQYLSASRGIDNRLSDHLSKVLNLNKEQSISQSQVWVDRSNVNTGKLVLDLDRQIAKMNLVFTLRADWLGVKINVGKPKIVGQSCTTFKAGDEGKVNVVIKNDGSSEGTFVTSLNCRDIKQSFVSTPVTFSAGETKTVSVTVDSSSFAPVGTVSRTCEITVRDYNKASNLVTSSTSCKVEPAAVCKEGQVEAVGTQITGCKDGKVFTISACGTDERPVFDESLINTPTKGYKCQKVIQNITKGEQEGSCAWYDVPCHVKNAYNAVVKFFSDLFSGVYGVLLTIKYIILAVASVLTTLASFDFLQRFRGIKKDWIRWILAIIAGGMVAYFLYIFIGSFTFYIILVGVGLYYMFMSRIKSFFIAKRLFGK